jgi:hypothetical protein
MGSCHRSVQVLNFGEDRRSWLQYNGSLPKFKEFLKISALLIFCVGIPFIAWSLMRIIGGAPDSRIPNPTYAELVAIILTAVTVVLAVLAIIVAILAVWGYRDIKKQAASAAERAIEATVATALAKTVNESSLEKMLEKHVSRMFRKHTIVSPASAYPQAYSDPYSVDSPQQVAIEYPIEGGEKHEG